MMKEPPVHVGILCEPQIEFILPRPYLVWGIYCHGAVTYHTLVAGRQTVTCRDGQIYWNNRHYDDLLFEPQQEETDAFELPEVTIGTNFHWERKEAQQFRGLLRFMAEDGKLTAVNIVGAEEYLASVIASEMSATASAELLKAHAVISRSWLLAQLEKRESRMEARTAHPSCSRNDEELIRWYDREEHTLFDICADDHCQRYQGITRATTERVRQAVADTCGQVLTAGGKICDTRFSKCCGGALEEFRYCWEDLKPPYLRKKRDWTGTGCDTLPDLTQEAEADRWIRSAPEAFCNTTDKGILAQVLNRYDQETTDFYRWRVEYTQDELSALIRERSGIDYGQIIDLVPMARGTSARLWKLKIVGTKQTLVIGKELEIRRTLSPTHLYSSAFVVDKEELSSEGIPGKFILTGSGWGHGVGLCQIGAAVMGEQGYTYSEILHHYYPGTEISKRYDHE